MTCIADVIHAATMAHRRQPRDNFVKAQSLPESGPLARRLDSMPVVASAASSLESRVCERKITD